MTDNDPLRLTNDSLDPYQDPLKLMQGHGTRRLVRFHVVCPLCSEQHSPEFYFTLPTQDMEEFAQAMEIFMASTHIMEVALKVVAQIHIDTGDIQQLAASLPGREVAFGVAGYEILNESQYSCDFCSESFPTIAGLRLDLGVPVHTAPDYESVQPVCRQNAR